MVVNGGLSAALMFVPKLSCSVPEAHEINYFMGWAHTVLGQCVS